jgi:hypothetical protein
VAVLPALGSLLSEMALMLTAAFAAHRAVISRHGEVGPDTR